MTVNVGDIIKYAENTDEDNDIIIYINDTPVGFLPSEIRYDYDGSIILQIDDPTLKIVTIDDK